MPFGVDLPEPDLSFLNAEVKVAWAKQHVQNLITMANRLIELYEQSAVRDLNEREIQELYALGNTVELMAGDAIFSLRSALDCCWMGLIRASDPDTSKTTLPRADTREGVEGTVKKAAVEATFPGAEKFILDEIRPYKSGREVLWWAAKLDNWNKHNMLLCTTRTTQADYLHIRTMEGGSLTFVNSKIHNSTLIASGHGSHPDNDADLTTEIIVQCRETGEERPLIPFITALSEETTEAVELFFSTFGGDYEDVTLNPSNITLD